MSKCIICGKEVDKTYGNSNLMGVYCRSCAIENHYTNEQLIEDLQSKLAEKEKTIINITEDSKASKELLKKQLAEKDKELEKIKSYNVALFASLYQILEKEDSENVSSRIDQLTAQNNSYTSDLYKCNKWYDRLDKSLQLACEYMCKYDVPCPNNKCEQKQCLEDKKFCYYVYFKFKAMEELDNE